MCNEPWPQLETKCVPFWTHVEASCNASAIITKGGWMPSKYDPSLTHRGHWISFLVYDLFTFLLPKRNKRPGWLGQRAQRRPPRPSGNDSISEAIRVSLALP